MQVNLSIVEIVAVTGIKEKVEHVPETIEPSVAEKLAKTLHTYIFSILGNHFYIDTSLAFLITELLDVSFVDTIGSKEKAVIMVVF